MWAPHRVGTATSSRPTTGTITGATISNHDGYGDVPFQPVRLFSLMIQQHEPALILLHSFFIDLLDFAERVIPAFTDETLMDRRPLMRRGA